MNKYSDFLADGNSLPAGVPVTLLAPGQPDGSGWLAEGGGDASAAAALPPLVAPVPPPKIPLGTITEIAATFRGDFGSTPGESARLYRAERFELQSVARDVLGAKHRIGGCLRFRHWQADTIDIHRSAVSGLAYYRGLMVCGLAAVCPCCGARVAEHRCGEIQTAIDAWRARDGQVGLITLTMPHYRSERLVDNLRALLDAYRDLGRNGPYRRLCQAAGLTHSVKSLEITWGPRNGFHPHLHVLGFFAGELDASAFEQALRRLWLGELRRRRPDLDAAAVQQHGAKFQLGFTHGAEYVSKIGRQWGLAEEVARANTKRGRGEHYTPPDLLRIVRDGERRWSWEARRVFREYVAGVKGAHLVQFSRGLRAALGLGEEKSDEEIAGGVEQGDQLLARLSPPAWAIVRAAGDRARVRLLEIAEGGDEAATYAYVLSLAAAAGVEIAGEVVA